MTGILAQCTVRLSCDQIMSDKVILFLYHAQNDKIGETCYGGDLKIHRSVGLDKSQRNHKNR